MKRNNLIILLKRSCCWDTGETGKSTGMKTLQHLLVATLAMFMAVVAQAQTMYNVQYWMEQGNYTEAAKRLRPLADGGNAEAQTLAARLFFEGKGVNKNETQGVKYAKMAADQGHEPAIELLVEHYESKPEQQFKVIMDYTGKHPYLLKGLLGQKLAWAYIAGRGTVQDEAKGWKLLSECNDYDKLIQTDSIASLYWSYERRQQGFDQLEQLAEYLENRRPAMYSKLVNYLDTSVYPKEKMRLMARATAGNTWAMCHLAYNLYERVHNKEKALEWARKAAEAGSEKGKYLVAKYSYVPQRYTNISIQQAPKDFVSKERLTGIYVEYDRMSIDFTYSCMTSNVIWINKNTHIQCDGRTYKMLSSTLPIEPGEKHVAGNQLVRHTIVFERIPDINRPFDIWEGDKCTWYQVKIK